jgi:hypothetical protein
MDDSNNSWNIWMKYESISIPSSIVDIIPSPEKVYQDDSNATMKDYTMT